MGHGAQHGVTKQRRPRIAAAASLLPPGEPFGPAEPLARLPLAGGEGPALPRRYPRLGRLMLREQSGASPRRRATFEGVPLSQTKKRLRP